jgi:hypothetical protein
MTANLHPLDGSPERAPAEGATHPIVDPTVDRAGEALRDEAVKRLRKKAEFRMHLLIYVLVNGMIVLAWTMTGMHFFWPIFVIGGWGIGLIAHGVDTYGHGTPSEEEISEEMARLRRG